MFDYMYNEDVRVGENEKMKTRGRTRGSKESGGTKKMHGQEENGDRRKGEKYKKGEECKKTANRASS